MPQAVYLERSPAKVNLYLNILDRRKDGYHNLETVFQAIELSDHITYDIQFEKGMSTELDFALEIDSNSEEIKALADQNIIAKAIELYIANLREAVIEDLASIIIKIFVDKNIPLEGGLAGGSSNAAATLRTLNKFFQENFAFSFSQEELLKLALELGSDVPFCLITNERSRVFATGRGEVFENKNIEFNFDQSPHLILVKPNFGISTKKAYEALKADRIHAQEIGFFNSFESVVYDQAPTLLEIHEAMTQANAQQVMLSGSGSTMLAFFKDSQSAQKALDELKAKLSNDYFMTTSSFLNITPVYS